MAGRQKYTFSYEMLMSFWQQLRLHGFTMRHIAPGMDRQLSYIIPIFAELDYVSPVNVTGYEYDSLYSSRLTGLHGALPIGVWRQN